MKMSFDMLAAFVAHIYHLHKRKPGGRKFCFCSVYCVIYRGTNKLAKPAKSFHMESTKKKSLRQVRDDVLKVMSLLKIQLFSSVLH